MTITYLFKSVIFIINENYRIPINGEFGAVTALHAVSHRSDVLTELISIHKARVDRVPHKWVFVVLSENTCI